MSRADHKCAGGREAGLRLAPLSINLSAAKNPEAGTPEPARRLVREAGAIARSGPAAYARAFSKSSDLYCTGIATPQANQMAPFVFWQPLAGLSVSV